MWKKCLKVENKTNQFAVCNHVTKFRDEEERPWWFGKKSV